MKHNGRSVSEHGHITPLKMDKCTTYAIVREI